MNMKYAMRSEDTEQINVVSWANWNMNRYPELRWLFHVPNGGSRNKQEAVKFKQMGVKAGVSDLCLPYPKGSYCGLFVEMKFGNNRQQDTQKEFLADMAAAGHTKRVPCRHGSSRTFRRNLLFSRGGNQSH